MTMNAPLQRRLRATYMRGGTSKGVFFLLDDLPPAARQPGPARDALLLRVTGSPDRYGKHIDGMGGATSSTSKVVLVSASRRPGYDVDYLFGQVAVDTPGIDWSGNCGNLTAAVGVFALHRGLIPPARLPARGRASIRLWQQNIGKRITTAVPVEQGAPVENGTFMIDGVSFPAAEIPVTFHAPASGPLFPTGSLSEALQLPGEPPLQATLISAGIPTIFLLARELGLRGDELQEELHRDAATLARLEKIRAHAAMAMGLRASPEEAAKHPHVPKIAFVAPPADYLASDGRPVAGTAVDLLARALSMGRLHHAMMGTAAVALAVAGAIPGTVVHACMPPTAHIRGGGQPCRIRCGHPSGTMRLDVEVSKSADRWCVEAVTLRRSARILMDGEVFIP